MMDQAEKLREIIEGLKIRQSASRMDRLVNISQKRAKVITVTSGKGGVGKTNITVNLAIALSELGLKVIIIDADFGLANVDVVLGIMPRHTLAEVINDQKSIIEILSDGPNNIRFISGGSGVEELVKLDKEQLNRFMENISTLDKLADIILIDTGAGLSESVMSFVMAADEVLLVTTPEPTSITDAYALVKMVANRDRNKVIKMIVNKAESTNEANNILKKLSLVSEKFLKINIQQLGYVLNDESVMRAVKLQQPFLLSNPGSQAARHIRDISRRLASNGENCLNNANSGIKGFIGRLVGFMSNKSEL